MSGLTSHSYNPKPDDIRSKLGEREVLTSVLSWIALQARISCLIVTVNLHPPWLGGSCASMARVWCFDEMVPETQSNRSPNTHRCVALALSVKMETVAFGWQSCMAALCYDWFKFNCAFSDPRFASGSCGSNYQWLWA